MEENTKNQISYSEDLPKIVSPNEPHMACLILNDKSGSMGGTSGDSVLPIDALNDALNQFKAGVCKDNRTR